MARLPSIALWLRGALFGAALGTIFLGIGGRIGMRAVATAQGAATGFSLGGTFTVIMLGMLSGAIAGLLYVASRLALKRRPALARALFAVVLLAIALRGLKPLDSTRLVIFLPLFLLFGFALDRLWQRMTRPSAQDPMQSVGVSAA